MSASTVIIERINGFQELETSTKRQTHLAEMILREIAQDVGVIAFPRNTASYCPRPRLCSQPPMSMMVPYFSPAHII
jgi:hypothetical protein